MKALTVVEAFGDYSRGSQITDAEVIDEILQSEQHTKVVAIELPGSDEKKVAAQPQAE